MPRDAVAICLPGTGGQWLAMRRALSDRLGGQVGFPAGKLEAGESQQDAVRREGFEELGVAVTPLSCFAVMELPELNVRLHAWLVSAESDDFAPNPGEVDELLWLTAADLAAHPDALTAVAQLAAQLPAVEPQ